MTGPKLVDVALARESILSPIFFNALLSQSNDAVSITNSVCFYGIQYAPHPIVIDDPDFENKN